MRCSIPHRLCAVVVAVAFFLQVLMAPATAQDRDVRRRLAESLAQADLGAVQDVVADAVRALGNNAGVPEEPDRFLAVPESARWLTDEQARRAFFPVVQEIAAKRWWHVGLDPSTLDHALREPASVVAGCVAAYVAQLEGADAALVEARHAADFLVWAQKQGGAGCYPFPAFRSATNDKAFAAAKRYLELAEKDGRLQQVVRNGWVIDDTGDGGLQFDNGEAGVAMFEIYTATGDASYLASALEASEWAMSRPMVPNWNYTSFSVYLLAKAFEITDDERFLRAATAKAVVGVIPGQLTEGVHAGRWVDAHNARPAYHYIMLRSLAALAAVMPGDDPARPGIVSALRLGLIARNAEFGVRGVSNKDKAMETLLLVQRIFTDDPEFLQATHSSEALDILGKLVSDRARHGTPSLAPREWAQFLVHVTERH